MLDNDPLHVLLLNPGFLPLLQVAEAVSPTINVNILQSSLKMVYIPDSSRTPAVHGRSLRVLELVLYARFLQDWTVGEGYQAHVILRHPEVHDAQPRRLALIDGGLDNAMDRRLVVSAAKEVHCVAGVYDLSLTG